ncbi:GNAT family N-acetyltransferase [Lapillicoccus sp.]|uniref:GNAT family N-acetyltransferase n=1 Tax=Lapillicoccus sp. TaxID=1909287 RepID=UPI0025E70CAF|nr:GNAT family N-acetyltransferase [Lapillicoccus sp.]
MQIRSLGYRSNLALLGYGGSEVEDRGTHLVVRSPHNPRFWWGNFLLLRRMPRADEAGEWLAEFRREFPQAEHRAFGVDVTSGDVGDLAPLAAVGLSPDVSVVMTATAVAEPAHPNVEAAYRPLRSDDDWHQQVALNLAGEGPGAGDLAFATARAQVDRRLVDQGRGAWWGAFLGGRLVSSMGLFVASEGLARFQNVSTHPDARGRGLAGTLVHRVGRYGLEELGATTLVMVADPEYAAIRIYRAVGFTDTERQLGCDKPPPAEA